MSIYVDVVMLRKIAAVLSPNWLVPSPAPLSFSNSHYVLYIPELMLTMPFLQNCKEVFLIFYFDSPPPAVMADNI